MRCFSQDQPYGFGGNQKMNGFLILRVLACAVIIGFTTATWSSTGKPTSFTCYTKKDNEEPTIVWSLKNVTLGINVKLFQCSNFLATCDQSEDKFLELYTANLTSNATTYTSVLTIKSVTPFVDNTTWLCNVNRRTANVSQEFYLNVFATPEQPTCGDVTLVNKTSLSFVCSTPKVFPKSLCLFNIITNATSTVEMKLIQINYNHELNFTTGYCKTTCSYTLSADVIGPGVHEFYVAMHPDINLTVTDDMKSNSNIAAPIELNHPEAKLRNSCNVNSYIAENEKGHCSCYNNKSSFLPNIITWSLSEKTYEANELTLNFTAKRPTEGKNQSFTCIISNYLNWTNRIDFKPNVSYLPSTLTLKISQPVLPLCNEPNVSVSGWCSISESNPKPRVFIEVNNVSKEVDFWNNSEYNFTIVESAGAVNISCFATNTNMTSSTYKKTETLTIEGPPESPLILKIPQTETNSSQVNFLKVKDGETLKCESKGGFPLSKNLTLTCGKVESHAFEENHVDLTFTSLNFTSFTNYTCDCTVEHATKCLLHNKTMIQVEFTASGKDVNPRNEIKDTNMIIGVAIAVSCGIIITILAVFIIKKSLERLNLKSSDLKENLVVNEDVYFIEDAKTDIDISFYPEYTNVITTITSAMEAPKNLTNKGKDQ